MRKPEQIWRKIFDVFLVGDIVKTSGGKIAKIHSLLIGWDPIMYKLYELKTDRFLGWYRREEIEIVRAEI